MENQKSPNHHEDLETNNGPDGNSSEANTPRKRRRIAYSPGAIVLSSDKLETNAPETIDPEAEVTEDDLVLLGDPDLDPEEGVDELIGNDPYLDDTYFDDDPLNESIGRRASLGRDLDLSDDELDNAGSGLGEEDEENDFLGQLDDGEDAPGKDEDLDLF
jgi:hypothetical protein